jgi:hypothetical protein
MKPISPGRRCCWHAPRATARPPATLPVRRARRTDPLLRGAARRARRAEALGYSTLLLRDHFVREPFGDQLVGRPVGVAGHKLVQQGAVWLGDAGVPQRVRRHHQHPAGMLVAGWVQQQAEVAVRHPAGHKDLAVGIGAELCHWPAPAGWVGHQATRPTRRAGGAPSRLRLPAAAASARWRRTARRRLRQHPLIAECGAEEGRGHDRHPLGWQPSRFLADRGEAERAFQLAERLGSVNAAAAELGTTWPSLRKAFTRHGLGMPARNPEAVRQRAIAAARQRTGQPATPPLDPVFVALNPDFLPARERSPAELYQWVRREEQYAILGANVVVELYSESHARQPTTRAWAIIRRADRGHRLAGQRASRPERRQAERADRPDRSRQAQEREMAADAR